MTIQSYSVISGTLRRQDLLIAFTEELARWDKWDQHTDIINATCFFLQELEESPRDEQAYFNLLEEVDELISEIMNILNEYALDGFYFGAHQADGSDFGFWPINE